MTTIEEYAADLVLLVANLSEKIKVFQADIESLSGKQVELDAAKQEIMDLKDELLKKDREIADLDRECSYYYRHYEQDRGSPPVVVVRPTPKNPGGN